MSLHRDEGRIDRFSLGGVATLTRSRLVVTFADLSTRRRIARSRSSREHWLSRRRLARELGSSECDLVEAGHSHDLLKPLAPSKGLAGDVRLINFEFARVLEPFFKLSDAGSVGRTSTSWVLIVIGI